MNCRDSITSATEASISALIATYCALRSSSGTFMGSVNKTGLARDSVMSYWPCSDSRAHYSLPGRKGKPKVAAQHRLPRPGQSGLALGAFLLSAFYFLLCLGVGFDVALCGFVPPFFILHSSFFLLLRYRIGCLPVPKQCACGWLEGCFGQGSRQIVGSGGGDRKSTRLN